MTPTTLSIKMQYILRKRKYFHEKNNKSGIFSLVFVTKLGGGMTQIFSIGIQNTDKGLRV